MSGVENGILGGPARLSGWRGRLAAPLVGWSARRLFEESGSLWNRQPHRVLEAIDKAEASWALARAPSTAILLAALYDRANLHEQSLVVLREAFHDDPFHPHIRMQAASTVLRHGTPGDVDDFVDSVLAVDPQDAFGRFLATVLGRYDGWVDRLASEIGSIRDGRVPFLLAYPVWGQPFAANFVRFTLAALASQGNLPALSQQHSAHVVVFTDATTEASLRSEAIFEAVSAHARIHFVRYDDEMTAYSARMTTHYGAQKAIHSGESLAAYYARECKFVLMSCAHYVSLLAGRRLDAMVSCGVADLAIVDGVLPRVAESLREEADAVLFHAIQLPGKAVRSVLDAECRSDGGVLTISREQSERLLLRHLPERNFLGSVKPYDMPLRICWRAGPEGVLMHGNHYHPIGLRPARFSHPLRLTTDPTDSRFIDRTSLRAERIHLAQDGGILGLSVDDDPLFEGGSRATGALSAEEFALWLWGYWGRLRGHLFRTPIRLGSASEATWRDVEKSAQPVIEGILKLAEAREATQAPRKTWKLTGAGRGCPDLQGMPEGTAR